MVNDDIILKLKKLVGKLYMEQFLILSHFSLLTIKRK
jgi:hypothetical protein